jgi:hypothetical protein
MDILCESYPTNIQADQHGLATAIPWLFHGYPMAIPRLSHGYSMDIV